MSQIEYQKQHMTMLVKHLNILQLQAAKFGDLHVPGHILIQIDELKHQIAQLQEELRLEEEREAARRTKTSADGLQPQQIRTELASLLTAAIDQIAIFQEQRRLLQVELPADAVEKLLVLHQQGNLTLQSREVQQVRVIREPATPVAPPKPKITPPKHPVRVSLIGLVIQGIQSEVKLLVENSSSTTFKQVALELANIPSSILLRPKEWDFILQAHSRRAFPLVFLATRAGWYELKVLASFIPNLAEGFLRDVIQINVQSPQQFTAIIEIELGNPLT